MMKKNLIISIFVFLMSICSVNTLAATTSHETTQTEETEYESRTLPELIKSFYHTTGLNAIVNPKEGVKDSHGEDMTLFAQSFGRVLMIIICFVLFYLAIKKGFEPLLLIPIGFGGILANIPIANIAGDHGMLGIIYNMGIANEFFPLLIFMGVGAMTDFISIIGGADGPTSIFIASALAPELLGAIAVAAYSYMALVPVIQPPIMRALTTDAERKIKMRSMRKVSKLEKIVFPIVVLVLTLLILPDASPLIGALCFGNFAKESGVVERLSDTMQNALINIVTIFLGLGVGSKLAAEQFLVAETMGIMVIGLVAFAAGTAAGLIMAKIMNKVSSKDNQINPLIGAAGVSAVPMAARVVSKEGQKYDPSNIMLMHAMGPNVAGVIGSAVAAGVLLSIFK
jgi:oxaloacetate decarboxylase beta subunit